MISLAIQSQDNFLVDMQEIFLRKSSYTYYSLKMLHKKYVNSILFFVIGADSYNNFHTWYRWEELFSLANFIVVNRGNEKIDNAYIDLNPNYLKSVIKLNISIPDISSSEIRNLITHNEKITGLLPREVEDYIYANELYKK